LPLYLTPGRGEGGRGAPGSSHPARPRCPPLTAPVFTPKCGTHRPAPGFPAPRGEPGLPNPQASAKLLPEKLSSLPLLSSFLLYQAKIYKNATFVSGSLQSPREKKRRCFVSI